MITIDYYGESPTAPGQQSGLEKSERRGVAVCSAVSCHPATAAPGGSER
jgi:hypothetical protein